MNPTQFTVALKDNNGNLVTQLQNKITALSWEWNRVGGCGACRMQVKEKWDGALASSFAEDYQIEIFMPSASGTAEQWYGGYIDRVNPIARSNDEFVNIFCLGYVNQLKRAIVENQTYTGQEISAIAKLVAEQFVTGITDITSAASDYEDTGFSADTLFFDESAFEVIKKLSDIAGRREWGVRPDKSFFFLTRNDSVKHFFHITEDISTFTPQKDFNPMITKIFLEGSSGYRQNFEVTNKITTRERIVSNSAITTQSVGQQFARAFLKENGIPRRSYTAQLIEQDKRLENIIPIGKVAINLKIGINLKYDVATQLYDSGLKYDGGTESFQVDRIQYVLTDNGVNVLLNLGVTPVNIVEDLTKLNLLIEQERIKI